MGGRAYQHSADEGAETSRCCDGRGGILREGINDIGLGTKEDADHAEAERNEGEDGNNWVMLVGVRD